MAERLWLATNGNGEASFYDVHPVEDDDCFYPANGSVKFKCSGRIPAPPPGECWEYVRTDCIDTESGALAAAKAEIERLKAELAEARKMPERVAKLVALIPPEPGELPVAIRAAARAVRRHYAPPITISIGEWRLTHGETCRVFSDGRQFLARLTGTMYAVQPDGQLDGRGVWLVERTGD